MRTFVIGILALASTALAQIETITLPNGNTVVISVGTNALGDEFTTTLNSALVVGGAAAETNTKTNTKTTTTVNNAVEGGAPTTTTGPRVVGVETTAPPMRTTTYWYDPGDGVWISQIWTASITAAPTVATAIVPAGTIQNYNSYQTQINSVVLKSAEAAEAASSGQVSGNIGAARRGVQEQAAGLVAAVVGFVGLGVGLVGL
ncbi:hypothetical protein BD324DRAFT_652567 [Kockovaella imperatae]|uniref:Uncharacterized protein n=1 Tax=Kockovaella imperatae TaxID=4999 RepID=A0A1Y1UBP1_9TREE|nr:hypothetical protein BD324DRAFT_652567 [Kockovaella imperatae]ORX35439.1 hypothetical protein BD324DRAFT_652567 [Kockovaella imperatae]